MDDECAADHDVRHPASTTRPDRPLRVPAPLPGSPQPGVPEEPPAAGRAAFPLPPARGSRGTGPAAAPRGPDPRGSPHSEDRPPGPPLEPILLPKLRIYFADFPYLLYPAD